jgi:hypothetical protein
MRRHWFGPMGEERRLPAQEHPTDDRAEAKIAAPVQNATALP